MVGISLYNELSQEDASKNKFATLFIFEGFFIDNINIVLLNVSAITLFLLVYEFNTDLISLIFSDLFQAAGFGRFFITSHSLPCNA